jgi:hypothetical protein
MTPGSAIAISFDSYRREVIPLEAIPVQIQECRRAFYAGAHAALCELMRIETGKPGDPITEDEMQRGARRVERLRLELQAFAEDMLKPKG